MPSNILSTLLQIHCTSHIVWRMRCEAPWQSSSSGRVLMKEEASRMRESYSPLRFQAINKTQSATVAIPLHIFCFLFLIPIFFSISILFNCFTCFHSLSHLYISIFLSLSPLNSLLSSICCFPFPSPLDSQQ